MKASVTERTQRGFSLFGKIFNVPVHRRPCAREIKWIWGFWQLGFFISMGIGFLLFIPIELVTNFDIAPGMMVVLGLPMATIVIAYLIKDLSPLQIFEVSNGLRYKFIFRHSVIANEFRRANLGIVVDDED